MFLIISLVIILVFIWFIVKVFNQPVIGIMLVFTVNPIEPFFPDLGVLTLGRVLGIITMLAWIYFLIKSPRAFRAFVRSKFTKQSLWYIISLIVTLLLWINAPDGIRALEATITFVLLIALTWMIESLVHSRRDLVRLAYGMAVATFLACFPAFMFNIGIDLYTPLGAEPPSDLTEETLRATTLGGNPNSLGIVARNGVFASILLIILSNTLKSRIIGGILFLGSIIGLVLSGSRTNFYGTIILLSIMILLSGKLRFSSIGSFLRSLGFLLGSLLLGLSVVPDPVKKRLFLGSDDDRMIERAERRQEFTENQQAQSLDFFEDYPLFGIGLDRTYYESNYYMGAHDTISVALGETGLVGFVLLLFLLLSAVFRSMKLIKIVSSSQLRLALALIIGMLISMLVMGYKGGFIIPYDRTFWMVVGLAGVLSSRNFRQEFEPVSH